MNPSTDQLLTQLKALADPVRARLVMLCGVADCSVSELVQVTAQSQPRISQQLKLLCNADILERFKDGHYVYYRVRTSGANASLRRQLLSLLPEDEPQFKKDLGKLRVLRGASGALAVTVSGGDRTLHKALVELTVARPLGDLLDIGCGHGRILKLLASRAQRAVGVDIDSDLRRLARAELLLAGTPNTTLRQGDMVALPFADQEFDTVILDDVLGIARNPAAALCEATRLLKNNGRLLLLQSIDSENAAEMRSRLVNWAAEADLRLSSPKILPRTNPDWLLAVATHADTSSVAA